jgi:hypothetical protein
LLFLPLASNGLNPMPQLDTESRLGVLGAKEEVRAFIAS